MKNFRPFYGSLVKDAVRGRWLEVYSYLASDELGVAIDKLGKHVTCPIHGTSNKSGKGDGFRLRKRDAADKGYAVCNSCGVFSDGFALLKAIKGWDYYTATIAIAQVLGLQPLNAPSERDKRKQISRDEKHSDPRPPIDIPPVTPERIREVQELQQSLADKAKKYAIHAKANIEKVWSESVPLNDGLPRPVYKWLKHRGVLVSKAMLCAGDHLRFHPSLPYYGENEMGERELVGCFPALIAAIRGLNGDIMTLHRTYLTIDGFKAPVAEPRKMMAIPDNFVGGAIQLGGFPNEGVLGVAEGLETSASPLKVYGIPTWSLVNTTFMSFFTPPEGVHTLLIWADRDVSQAGELAATALKERVEKMGINAHILLPKRSLGNRKSIDWNDIILKEGIYGFPQWGDIQRFLQLPKGKISNLS